MLRMLPWNVHVTGARRCHQRGHLHLATVPLIRRDSHVVDMTAIVYDSMRSEQTALGGCLDEYIVCAY